MKNLNLRFSLFDTLISTQIHVQKSPKLEAFYLGRFLITLLCLLVITLEPIVAQSTDTGTIEQQTIEDVIESVQFEIPVDLEWTYLLPPEGSSPFVAKFILHNAPPVRPPDPGFPSDFCPSDATLYTTATGEGSATHIGRFTYSERWCGMPGKRVVLADVVFTAEDGDELHATGLASAGPTIPPPPFPHATFTGTYTITGGTGRFRGARGKASIAGQQLDHQPERDMPAKNFGSTAIGLAGWINLHPSDTSQSE